MADRLYEKHPKYYLAYGSNHNMVQMYCRCPDAEALTTATLNNWRLAFSGVLTIEQHQGESVPLSVWRVSASDIAALDRYEGYPYLYDKMLINVVIDGKAKQAFTYTLNKPWAEGPPTTEYYRDVYTGYLEHELPIKKLQEAYERSLQFGASPLTRYRKKDIVNDWTEYVECERCGHWFPPDEVVRDDDNTYICWECALDGKPMPGKGTEHCYRKDEWLNDELWWEDTLYRGGRECL